ncbi:hypothetical protein O181_070050 [Austropuccinia psidii MF-1]|uniref:Uncharacterized protein n=1 Tax=Austropuccinia psidii MF-1 TaxID=1389203 RepID=A0A9Q3I8N7_9BASI|nr:hypothetical protein [Austropuccinia psidii MF-1]
MLADKHTRNAFLLCNPSNHSARAFPSQYALVRTPLWSAMMKEFPSGNGHQDPKQADRSNSRELAWFHLVSICPPPLLGHHTMLTSLPYQREVIIRGMKDDDGERTFVLGLIVTMPCHPWDSNSKGSFFLLLYSFFSMQLY